MTVTSPRPSTGTPAWVMRSRLFTLVDLVLGIPTLFFGALGVIAAFDPASCSFTGERMPYQGAEVTTAISFWPPGVQCTYTIDGVLEASAAPSWVPTLATLIGLGLIVMALLLTRGRRRWAREQAEATAPTQD